MNTHRPIINFNRIVRETKVQHNEDWSYTPDHPSRILVIGGRGTGKTNMLLNLIDRQSDIDKIYLYVKDPYEPKYQYMINKRQNMGKKYLDDPNLS